MKLENTNRHFTDKQIKEIIRFVKPSNVSRFTIHVKNSKLNHWGGYCYTHGCSYGPSQGPLITVRVGPHHNLRPFGRQAHHVPGRKGYLPFTVFSHEELMVHIIAHELRHLWQKKIKRGYRVWGARGQYSERDADAYAIRMTRKWRREHTDAK